MRGFICWIFFCLYVLPLAGGAVLSYLLHSVGHEDVKMSSVIPYIAEDDLAISIKYLRNLIVFELFSQ